MNNLRMGYFLSYIHSRYEVSDINVWRNANRIYVLLESGEILEYALDCFARVY